MDLWDVNVLVYAHRTDLPEFERFRPWLEEQVTRSVRSACRTWCSPASCASSRTPEPSRSRHLRPLPCARPTRCVPTQPRGGDARLPSLVDLQRALRDHRRAGRGRRRRLPRRAGHRVGQHVGHGRPRLRALPRPGVAPSARGMTRAQPWPAARPAEPSHELPLAPGSRLPRVTVYRPWHGFTIDDGQGQSRRAGADGAAAMAATRARHHAG